MGWKHIENFNLSKEYYIEHIIYNLRSFYSSGSASSPINEARIANLIGYLHINNCKPLEHEQGLKLFIKEIVALYIKGTLDISNFSTEYLDDSKKNEFKQFIKKLFADFEHLTICSNLNEEKAEIYNIAANIHHSIRFHRIFVGIDGFLIASLLEAYILMRVDLQLPQVLSSIDQLTNFPKDSSDESRVKWQAYYAKQFGAWDIGSKETIKQMFTSNETMLNNITRDFQTILDMQLITGEMELENLIVHNLDRSILHAFIVKYVSGYQVTNEDHLCYLVRKNYESYMVDVAACEFDMNAKNVPRASLLHKSNSEGKITLRKGSRQSLLYEINKKQKYYERLIDLLIKHTFFSHDNEFNQAVVSECREIMRKKETIITSHENLYGDSVNVSYESKQKLYVKLVVDELLRRYIKEKAEWYVENFSEGIVFDNAKLHLRENIGRLSWIVAGGPASGKTAITKIAEKDLEGKGDKFNTAKLNPDYYKKILLDIDDKSVADDPIKHAELTHAESSYINKRIVAKMKAMISQDKAPDILFDSVKASQDKIGVTIQGNATVNIYMATCSPKEAVRRAFDRGRRHGRFVPTEIILEGHKESTRILPDVLANNKVVFRLFNTDVPKGEQIQEIASINDRNKILEVYKPRLMLDFILKAKINIKAKSPDEIYQFESGSQMAAQQEADCLLEYIKQGLTLKICYYSKERYKACAVISLSEGFLITNMRRFTEVICSKRDDTTDLYIAHLIYYLSQSEINNKKLTVSIHSGKSKRKEFYIENGQRLYCARKQQGFLYFIFKYLNQLLGASPLSNEPVLVSHLEDYTDDNAHLEDYADDNAQSEGTLKTSRTLNSIFGERENSKFHLEDYTGDIAQSKGTLKTSRTLNSIFEERKSFKFHGLISDTSSDFRPDSKNSNSQSDSSESDHNERKTFRRN